MKVRVRWHRRWLRRRKEPVTFTAPIARTTMTVADVESKYGGISPKGIMMFYGKKGRKKALVKSAKDIPPVAGLPHGFANLSESVADTIDDLFGWNIVPPTSAREMERGPEGLAGGEFTVQEWVPDSKTMSAAVDYDKQFVFFDAHYDRVMKMAVLDFIIANRDRHTGNIIVTNRTKQKLEFYSKITNL